MTREVNISTAEVTNSTGRIEGRRFDWLMMVLGFWYMFGLFIDGWAHNHGRVDDSFFTPWHAIFYSGFLVTAAAIAYASWHNYRLDGRWRTAIPAGYELAAVGSIIFAASGVGDLIWHELFGIEEGIEPLLSPTHLSLAIGMSLVISGPFRAAWYHSTQKQIATPTLLSFIFTWSVITFLMMFNHPLNVVAASRSYYGINRLQTSQMIGITAILLHTFLFIGPLLLIIRRWELRPGTISLMLTLNALLMAMIGDEYRFVIVMLLMGSLVDLLQIILRPRTAAWRFHLFAFLAPVIIYTGYFLTIIYMDSTWWTVHAWVGTIAMAGIAGWLVSYLVYPPAVPHIGAPD